MFLKKVFLYTLLLALINTSLAVPQYKVIEGKIAHVLGEIDEPEEDVQSNFGLICDHFTGIEVPTPIHENAHYLEQDFTSKRLQLDIKIIAQSAIAAIGNHFSIENNNSAGVISFQPSYINTYVIQTLVFQTPF